MSEKKNSEKKNEERDVLAAWYCKKAFVKVRQCLEIEKIKFSFVDLSNADNFIDCYLSAEEFGATLISAINDKTLIKKIIAEKAKGDKYPKAIWRSPIGGNATGNNGKPISRFFEIAPSTQGEVVFSAYSFPAEKNDKGAFIKVKNASAILTLRVPCSFNDLKILAYKWGFLENDYMSKKYTLENMRSDYRPVCNDTFVSGDLNDTAADDSEEYSYSPGNEDVPYVGTDTSSVSAKVKEKAIDTKMKTIRLVATSALEDVKGKQNIKVCRVTENGIEHRLICLMNRIADKKRFSSFESQLKTRISSNGTLEFKAEVAEKGNDLYLLKFA